MQVPGSASLARAVNRSHRLAGTAFDPATPFGPPTGRYRTVHYGVMIPNLPAPLRFLDVVAVIGQPPIPIWRNEHLIQTTAADTVSLLVGSGAAGWSRHVGLSAAGDCDFAHDGSRLRFGNELELIGRFPAYELHSTRAGSGLELQVTASRTVTHFAKLVGGLYEHWSLLCRYQGRVEVGGSVIDIDAAGTLEYARGAALPLPFRFFTYHVVNLDERTQILFGQVLGPLGAVVQNEVHVRSLDEPSRVYRTGVSFEVHDYEPEPRITPDGRAMRLPRHFSWSARDGRGRDLVRLDGRCAGDFTYGVAAGYAGSFDYDGTFRGEPFRGTGYLEYIDGR